MTFKQIFLIHFLSVYATFVYANNHQYIGSVASAHPLATQAGLHVLKKGGTAFDAAIAVASTLNVVEPMMSGIGGYGTILIYDAKKAQVRYLNSSGRFPRKTSSDLMRKPTTDYLKNRVGPKSISTPGNLNAWEDMHKKYGTMPWKCLFKNAIFYAENGFKISSHTAKWIQDAFDDFSEYSKSFYGTNKQPLQEGDVLIQLDLAKTFKHIAKFGAKVFYSGNVAQYIDMQMKEIDSFLAIEDLQNNRAEWWDPIKFNYKGYDIYTASPPANSFAGLIVIGLMQHFNPIELEHNSSNYLHLIAETAKESYKARLTYSYDPEVKTISLNNILSPEKLQNIANTINVTKASDFIVPLDQESHNTTHFVVVDKSGNIVSATQTLGNLFGSRVMIKGTGIWMNSSMTFSTFEPKGNPMDVFPNRHKLSGDCPIIIIKDKLPWAALGTPGGHTITQNVPQIIFNLIDFNMKMQEAIDSPKISFIEPNLIRAENGISEEVINSLKKIGHQVERGIIGNANGIKILRDKTGKIISFDVGKDKRRDGQVTTVNSSI